MRSLARLILIAAALALAGVAGAQTRITIPTAALEQEQSSEAQRISIQGDANERIRLREMLVDWRAYTQEGNHGDATDVVGQMREFLQIDAIKDKETLVGAFVAMGHDWTITNSWDLAERAFKAALEIDPNNGAARLGHAELVRQRDGGVSGWLGLFAGVVQSWRERLLDGRGALAMLSNAMLLVMTAICVTLAGIAFVLLLRNSRLLRHGVMEAVAQRVPRGVDAVIGWVLVLLPVLLWLSPPWWVLWWLALLSGYGTPALRRLAIVGLAVAIVVPIGFHAVALTASLQQDPILRAHARLQARDLAARDIQAVATAAKATDATAAWFLLGRLQAAAGKADEAVESYGTVASRASGDVRATVNRANVHFRRGDIAQALSDYKLAVDRDPRSALAWRNGAIAHAQNLQADISTEWVQRAQRLDRGSVQQWARDHGADKMVDADLSFFEVLALVFSTHPEFHLGALLAAFLNPLSIGAAVAFIHAFVRARRGLGVIEAAACEKCGRAFCSRCHAAAKSSAYCTQCVHLYVKKDGVSPVVRAKKVKEVERHVAMTNVAVRLFNLVVPGAGSLLANRIGSGVLTMLLWGGALALLLLPAHMLVDPGRVGQADMAVVFAAELALLVIIYIIALLQSLRHSG